MYVFIATGKKGNKIFIQNVSCFCKHCNIVLILCLQTMFLAAHYFLYTAVKSLFSFFFFSQLVFAIRHQLSVLYEHVKIISAMLYFEDIANGRMSSLFWTTLCIKIILWYNQEKWKIYPALAAIFNLFLMNRFRSCFYMF